MQLLHLGVAIALAALRSSSGLLYSSAAPCRSCYARSSSAQPLPRSRSGRTVRLAAVDDDGVDLPLVSLNQRRTAANSDSSSNRQAASLSQQQKKQINELGADDGV